LVGVSKCKKQDTQTRERKYYSYLIFLAMQPFWF